MFITHIAIWTNELEKMKEFYERYFGMVCGEKYHNPQKNFSSYFLSFSDGAQIELMTIYGLKSQDVSRNPVCGIAHFAIQMENRQAVGQLTERFRSDGIIIFSEPRLTGDGYYESCILDPDGNQIELVSV
ncbi:MAG: hypothetical protein CL609_20440 [Anaerolineaceae bacterium]|nr:hypothetical protein [Anaerolineaceae bacterium]